ncbi:MAG TPA: hypothetical protein VG604_02555 [Candidatus Saccharimonadales bacterium]|nr:hypothetical protein [Candidatus Saccharimonadales bacterium]
MTFPRDRRVPKDRYLATRNLVERTKTFERMRAEAATDVEMAHRVGDTEPEPLTVRIIDPERDKTAEGHQLKIDPKKSYRIGPAIGHQLLVNTLSADGQPVATEILSWDKAALDVDDTQPAEESRETFAAGHVFVTPEHGSFLVNQVMSHCVRLQDFEVPDRAGNTQELSLQPDGLAAAAID